MSLTRKALAAMGIEEEKIDQIIEMHTSVTSELKTKLDAYKADAERLPAIQKELNELKTTIEKDGENQFKVKYEAIKEEFSAYKQEQKQKAEAQQKRDAYRSLLQEAKVSEKWISRAMKASETAIDAIKLDKDGDVADKEKVLEEIKAEWGDCIETTEERGASTATPPSGNGKTYKTMDEILAIKDVTERQNAIAENHELFGF